MKRAVILGLVLALVPAGAALGALGKHDLSSNGGQSIKTTGSEKCVFCHVPHNSQPAAKRPLWNHELSSTALTWEVGASTSRGTTLPTTTAGSVDAKIAPSQACLSCHDGTVGLGSIINGTDLTATGPAGRVSSGQLRGSAYFNPTTFSKNHPIGVAKPTTTKEGFTSFKDPTANGIEWVNIGSDKTVQCQSCHNPHINETKKFLRTSDGTNTGSKICLECHNL